jgi:Sec-independent protein translocase protein TatA
MRLLRLRVSICTVVRMSPGHAAGRGWKEKKRRRGQRARKRVSRKRQRTELLVLVWLAVLVLGASAFFGVGWAIESALRADVQGVEQVDNPTGTEAPEIFTNTSTKEKDEEETADDETFTEEATEAEDAQLED